MSETGAIPRMRTAKECASYFKEQDPNTKIYESSIRRMALNGEIPSVKCGNRILINLDTLVEKLYTGCYQEEKVNQNKNYGKIVKMVL